MRIGPWLVIRGLIFGNFIVILFTSFLSANASIPAYAAAEQPVAESSIAEASPAVVADQTGEPSGAESCTVSARFPEEVRQWCGVITRYADEHDLPPDLVAAVIWQESGGDPQAYSHSGAVGLMQVMPRDGIAASFQCINGPCFASRPNMVELRDPEFNVFYGTRMLGGLFEKHGSWRDALKAYGPMDRGYSYADKVLSLYKNYGQ
jgi:soluble lytic murein transglycosylase-like protein